MTPPTAFYCVADARYFLGAVAMINSLRLQGHDEPIYVLDCGLGAGQREVLGHETTVVPAPGDGPPYLLKSVAPLAHPAEVMVLIDVDMIVTRPLTELIECAREGKVVAFDNDVDRFVPEWGELLDLGPLRRGRYVCSGLVAAGGDVGAQVLELLDDRQHRVDFTQSHYGTNDPAYPFLYPEQDVLNAILASELAAGRVTAYPLRLAPMPPFAGLRITDELGLGCAYADGEQPFVVHHFGVKPWLARLDDGVYSRLLRRALSGPGVSLPVPRERVPSRLRNGLIGLLQRKALGLGYWVRWHVLDPLGATARRLWSRASRRRSAERAGDRLLRAFADRYPDAVFIGVGANDGRSFDPIWRYVTSLGWRGVLVEPVPHVFARLRDNCRGLERVALENSAIAAEDGRLVLHHLAAVSERERAELPEWYDAVGSASRERVLAQASKLPDAERRLVTVEVACMTFESLCRKHGIDRVDLLAIDVEGQDSEVIEGVDFDRHRPRVIVYEHVHLSAADRRVCRAKLERLGYGTMEEGMDTYCLDTAVDDGLTRLWDELSPVVPGISPVAWDSFARSAPSEREWEAFLRSQKDRAH